MKLLLIFGVVVLAALAQGEFCDDDDDCTLTVCKTGFKVDCYKHHDDAQVCTCAQDGDNHFQCTSQKGCEDHFGDCNHGDRHWHCIDNGCRCSWFGGGGN